MRVVFGFVAAALLLGQLAQAQNPGTQSVPCHTYFSIRQESTVVWNQPSGVNYKLGSSGLVRRLEQHFRKKLQVKHSGFCIDPDKRQFVLVVHLTYSVQDGVWRCWSIEDRGGTQCDQTPDRITSENAWVGVLKRVSQGPAEEILLDTVVVSSGKDRVRRAFEEALGYLSTASQRPTPAPEVQKIP